MQNRDKRFNISLIILIIEQKIQIVNILFVNLLAEQNFFALSPRQIVALGIDNVGFW